MKNIIFGRITTIVLCAAAGILPVMTMTARAERPTETTGVNFFGTVRAGACDTGNPSIGMINALTPDSALVYGAPPDRSCVPVTAPDGHQLTLGEFKAIQGTATVRCVNRGTLVNVHLTGLQPKGTYTAWVPVTAGNIFPPAIAATALGSVLGDDTFVNSFTASASGEGQITLIQPEGIGTFAPGPIPQCLQDVTFEVHIAYHMDGEAHGPVPGPPTTWVVPERFLFPVQ